MKQEESVEFCTTLDMIEDYFTKSLQGYKFRCFCNIILVIHEDGIPSYNTSVNYFFEEQKIKLKKEKEETQKAAKLAGELVNQGVCWVKYIRKSLLTDY